jgi:hypothetical protein
MDPSHTPPIRSEHDLRIAFKAGPDIEASCCMEVGGGVVVVDISSWNSDGVGSE